MKTVVSIVGMQWRGTEALVASLPAGETLICAAQPDNPKDPNAVMVWARDQHVGFVKATQTRDVLREIARRGFAWSEPEPVTDCPSKSESVTVRRAIRANLAIDGGRWPMAEIDDGKA